MRLVGLAQHDPRVVTSGAGAAAKFLFDALQRRHELVARSGVDLTRLQSYALAALTFHPDRARWRTRYHWKGGRLALELRSRNSRGALAAIDQPFDLVIQNFGLFHTRGAPFVIYIDNTIELSRRHWPRWVEVDGRGLEGLYRWERSLYRDALHVFTMGGPAARSVVDFYGVAPERVTTVGAGATLESLPERSAREREPVVLFVGNDWRRKGGDVLVEAFREVRAKLPKARLMIVGTDEPERESGVEVVGFVDNRRRLADIYARASVYCMPSRFEPYGLSVVDAMAYELPCVVSTAGALDEIALDGETGLVVEPDGPAALAGALLRLLEDREFATRLGQNGRSRVEHHLNWDAVVERMPPGLEHAAGRAADGAARRPASGRFRRRAREPVSR
jgi:alpha-maltose-1-phosphate synthase